MSHPLLAPHALLAWRDTDTLAVLDPLAPESTVTIGNATAETVSWLRRCDGTRPEETVLAAAVDTGIDPASARAVLTALSEHGLLGHCEPGSLPRTEAHLRSPSLREAQALALGGSPGEQALERRSDTLVAITGADRVAHALVDALSAARIGALQALGIGAGRRRVTLREVAVPGPAETDLGAQAQTALKRHIVRVHGSPPTRPRSPLVVATGEYLDAGEEALVRRLGVPYLSVLVSARTAVIGPLTLPGRSACRECIEHTRAQMDPDWPALLTQREHRRREPTPVDGAFAMWVAALAAMHLLQVIDHDDPGPLVNTTLHIDRATRSVRRRTWAQHPACACSWS